MKTTTTRLLSVLLCLAMIFCSIPQSILAEASETLNELLTNGTEAVSVSEDAYVLGEVIDSRTESSKTFRMSDGSFVAADYGKPIHYSDENGDWQDYDNTLSYSDAVDSEDIAGYGTSESDISIKLANNSNSGNLLKIKMNGYKISLSLPDANKSKALELYPQTTVADDDSLDSASTLTKFSSGAIYKDILDGTDLEYIISGSNVKENIIVKEKQDSYVYTFELKLNDLVPVLNEDGSIALNDENTGVTQLVIPKGIMSDADYAVSDGVTYSIAHKNGKKYTLTVTADAEWINSDERVFPVKIDPSVEAFHGTANTDDTYVSEYYPNSTRSDLIEKYWNMVSGYNNRDFSKEWHALIKPSSLPAIPASAVIVNASLQLVHADTSIQDVIIAALPITSSWTSSTVTWNTKPTYDNDILDYVYLTASNEGNAISFDITRLAQKWYNGSLTCNGIALVPLSEGDVGHAYFYSCEYPTVTAHRPQLIISYRDTKGLESIWTYSSHGAGSAGAGYVNGFNGNLVFVHDDMSTKGSILPITVSHVFNSYMAGGEFEPLMPIGYGWKLSVQETLAKETIDNKAWYKYNDADGTDLYFYHDDNTMAEGVYESEDGYGLTVTETSSGATLADDYGNVKTFNSNGQITKIQDVYGNKKEFTYNGSRILSITYTPAGETEPITQLTFSYNINGVLWRITDGYDSTDYVEFYYSATYNGALDPYGYGYLRKIQYSSGEYCTYEYYSDGKLKSTYDSDTGYTVTYTYNGFRVISIGESVGTTQGQRIGFEYEDKYFSVRSSGKDDAYGNSDDLYTVTLFDNYGRAICSYTKDYYGNVYGASYAKYTENDVGLKTNNKLTVSSVKGITAENLIKDGGMEASAGWFPVSNVNDYTRTFTTEESLYGSYSLKISKTTTNGIVGMRQYATIPEAGTYTLSAYVKTSGVTATSGGACIQLGTTLSEYVTGTTDTTVQNGWRRISVTHTFDNPGTYDVYLFLDSASGTAYFDNVQLEKAEIESDYNFIQDSSVRTSTCWTGAFSKLDTEVYRGHVGSVTGSAASAKSVYQTIPLNVPADTTFMVSGWARANSVKLGVPEHDDADPERRFGLSVILTYSDNTTEEHYASFNPENIGWQYLTAAVVPEKDLTVTSAKVAFVYDYNCNTAYFDDISFTIEPAQTYEYDPDTGKLETATDIYGQNESLEYDDSGVDLEKYTSINNGTYTYDYHYVGSVNTHDIETAIRTVNNITQTLTYSYNDFGNVIGSVLSNSVTSEIISSSAEYEEYGNFLTSSTDSLGGTTTYNYDSVTKLLKYIQDANNNRTAYTYDNRDRVTTVYLDADKDDVADTTESSVAYLYASGRLSGINTATTAYTITYDIFGNMVSVSAGGNVLATYTYTAGNGKLTRMTYGNGEYEEYTYDNLDRLVKVTYNGSSENAFTVLYDSNGRLAKAVDGKAGITYLYEYDSLDRLIRAYQKDPSGNTIFAVENSYDEYGRAKSSNVVIGNKSMEYVITYKTNTNLVSNVYMPETDTLSAINYTYDNFDRLTEKNISLSSLADFYEKYSYYTYTDTDENVYTTPLVATLTLKKTYGGTASSEVYEYTYNSLGYITNVKKNGTTIVSYSYDALGQLVREINADSGEIYVYTYDKAGNIAQKLVFTGDIGNLTDTINYTYSASAWGDLLTNYDGTAITYDSIGNPTKWRNSFNLTWDGRTLTSQTLTNGNSITYKYNSDGIRTQKRVFDDVASAYITHDYVLDGTKILSETVTDNAYYNSYTLYYIYDASGSITGLHYNNQPYYFQKNIQGDILRILDRTGTAVVEYTYDAWGNILSVTGSMANTLGQYNPFRYRGYYYDSETDLYYLNSRYYDAEVGRFINADGIVGANGGILGYNMFAYCSNNPIAFADYNGNTRLFAHKNLNDGPGSYGGLGVPANVGIGLAALLVASIELIESAVEEISDAIGTIQSKIAKKIKTAAEEKRKSEAIEKIIEETKKLDDGQCLIIAWKDDGIPFIYAGVYGGVVSIEAAITITTSDMMAGRLSLFPSEYRNIAIVTPLKSDAFRFIAGIGSIPDDDKNWARHSPMPHYHTTPHILTVGGKEYDIHAFFLN